MAINKDLKAYITVQDIESSSPSSGNYVPISGGTMTGDLIINRKPGRLTINTPGYEGYYGVIIENTSSFGNEVNFYGGYGLSNFMRVASVGASSEELGNLFLQPNGRRTIVQGTMSAKRTSIGQGTNGTLELDAYGAEARIGIDGTEAIYILGADFGSANNNVGIGNVSSEVRLWIQGKWGSSYSTYPNIEMTSGNYESSIYFKPYSGDTNYRQWAAGAGCWAIYDCFAVGVYQGPNSSQFGMYIDNSGNMVSRGAHYITSDETLKKNISPVSISIKDIASAPAVTFDWKDGSGHSAGSIAQYWKPIIPDLVKGEDGNMKLSYDQLGLVNTIVIANDLVEKREKIKELNNAYEKRKKSVDELERKISVLRSIINKKVSNNGNRG